MNDPPRQKLCELIAEYGRSLCDDPRRCEALLRDYCGQYKREIFVLMSALKERVVEELGAARQTVPPALLIARLAKRLHANLGLAEAFAQWAVESWALALGFITRPQITLPVAAQAETSQGMTRTRVLLPAVDDIHGWRANHVQVLQQQTAMALGLPVRFRDRLQDGTEGPAMVVIPAGRFLMGSPENELGRRRDEQQHRVTLAQPFAIGRHTVTFEEYDCFATATGREHPPDEGWGRERRPVINVSWEEALAYTGWLSGQIGRHYRLPTEAEWEYAARAGSVTPFHRGATLTPLQANYHGNGTLPVGQFDSNAWGLYDIHGNVWEWTGSVYEESCQGAEQQLAGAAAGYSPRVLRGGSWRNHSLFLRAAFRARLRPDFRNNDSGFRLVREL
jgi:formylglycine-generating enzyme required for sulfatase activity